MEVTNGVYLRYFLSLQDAIHVFIYTYSLSQKHHQIKTDIAPQSAGWMRRVQSMMVSLPLLALSQSSDFGQQKEIHLLLYR